MWELEKAILVTNNDRVYEKYKDQMKVILLDGYEDVLIKVRDLVYDKHVLLTHPQASSLKPNQTPYRSVVVYPKGEEDNIKDIMLIDKCIQVYQEWQDIAPSLKSEMQPERSGNRASHQVQRVIRKRWRMILRQSIYR